MVGSPRDSAAYIPRYLELSVYAMMISLTVHYPCSTTISMEAAWPPRRALATWFTVDMMIIMIDDEFSMLLQLFSRKGNERCVSCSS